MVLPLAIRKILLLIMLILREIENINLRVSYDFTKGENTNGSDGLNSDMNPVSLADMDDPSTEIMVVALAYQDFSVGINSVHFQNHTGLAPRDIEALALGARYRMNETTIGFGMMSSKEPASQYRAGVNYEEFIVGITRALPFNLALGLYYQDAEATYRSENGVAMSRDASVVALTVTVNF